MKCPNCGKEMRRSDVVFYTSPVTWHLYCECGLVLDECGGELRVCFTSKVKDVVLPEALQ